MILPSQRRLFDIPGSVCYLNCAFMSPQLRSVREAGERAIARKSRPWEIVPGDFFEDSETARELFAGLVNGYADGVALIPSVSYGMAVAAANVRIGPGQSILILEEQFPSNVYQWMELAGQSGADLVTVPRPADHDWTGALLERINDNTALVAVPNCHWTDGSLLDLVRVGVRAREVRAALVVDATQSLGVLPFDVSKVRPDFLVTSAYKWMLGPYSLGFLYVGDEWRMGKPLEHNWIARTDSQDFSGLVEYRSGFQSGARRYDVGERSNFALLPMALAAIRQILNWQVENIAETLRELTCMIEARAAKSGFETTPSDRRAPHMIGLHLGRRHPEGLAAKLAAKDVFVSVRGDKLRVSPHLYNTEADVEHLFSVLEETARR